MKSALECFSHAARCERMAYDAANQVNRVMLLTAPNGGGCSPTRQKRTKLRRRRTLGRLRRMPYVAKIGRDDPFQSLTDAR